jgi:hypothetical protein
MSFASRPRSIRLLWLVVSFFFAGCAHQPPTVDFLYKGMKKENMLQIMGEPLQVIKTYDGPDGAQANRYQFSNSKCEGERKVVCTVSVTQDGIVYGWSGVKKGITEDGQK